MEEEVPIVSKVEAALGEGSASGAGRQGEAAVEEEEEVQLSVR